jgi:hypothetical protein
MGGWALAGLVHRIQEEMAELDQVDAQPNKSMPVI